MDVEAIGAAARALTKALDKGPGIVPDAMVLADFLQALFEEGYCVARIEQPDAHLMEEVFQRDGYREIGIAQAPPAVPLPPMTPSPLSGTASEIKPSFVDEIPF